MIRCTKDKRLLVLESWKKQTDERKLTVRCNKTIKFSTNINNTIESNLNFIYKKNSDLHQKSRFIKGMVNNYKNVQRKKMKKW